MNLRELLLQFEGENEKSLKIDDLLTDNVAGIEVERNSSNGIKVLVEDPQKIDFIKNKIKDILDKNGYEEYSIIPETNNGIKHIDVMI